MPRNMGLDYGLEKSASCIKMKFRWLLEIPEISADGASALPPQKSARPNLSFKEIEAKHLNENIYFPGRPEWKPINLTLYDLKTSQNKIFQWIQEVYDSCQGSFKPVLEERFKKKIRLKMYDGCGNTIETWVYENAWPNSIEWGDLDMASNEIMTVDLTLRYDRAYIEEEC